jgi:hypothetical protein
MTKGPKKSLWDSICWIVIIGVIGYNAGDFFGEKKVDQIKEKLGINKVLKAKKKLIRQYSGIRNGFVNNLYFYSDGSAEYSAYNSNDFKTLQMGCFDRNGPSSWKDGNDNPIGYVISGPQNAGGRLEEHLNLSIWFNYINSPKWSDGFSSKIAYKAMTLYEKRHVENGMMVGGSTIRQENFNPYIVLNRKK